MTATEEEIRLMLADFVLRFGTEVVRKDKAALHKCPIVDDWYFSHRPDILGLHKHGYLDGSYGHTNYFRITPKGLAFIAGDDDETNP